ncbi:MAG: hypothetical protein GC146_04185 [Limimaricola sp.]|uniref:hypothetical protein n=1 Tax=Limimaricola sp. TaxID=2211665 RepID=UPI001D42ABB5|nr:hypothetical protein [Limimaricola sp.]MBI1416401.1 hypothetical protein [Limimaricola sp.]
MSERPPLDLLALNLEGRPVGFAKFREGYLDWLQPTLYQKVYSGFFIDPDSVISETDINRAWSDYISTSMPKNSQIMSFRQVEVPLGHYLPRIARVGISHPNDITSVIKKTAADMEAEAIYCGRLRIAIERFQEIAETVHLSEDQMLVFGDQIRNLLILAATEVESQFKSVLKVNGIAPKNAGTKDYIVLNGVMRLSEYKVRLVAYPWIQPFSPFLGWVASEPTKSLSWYHAYNETKHDSLSSFRVANLKEAISAIIAQYILCVAQFGAPQIQQRYDIFRSTFDIVQYPKWDVSEIYAYQRREEWQPIELTRLARK